MEAIDIPLLRLALLYCTLLLPLHLLKRLGLRLNSDILLSLGRMTIQLFLVGIYLKYLFEWNSIWLNTLWVTAVTVVANLNILRKTGLSRRLFWPSFASIASATLSTVAFFLLVLIEPQPLYDARYLIPLTGMLLGNCLSGNVIALERFYAAIRSNETEYLSYLLMGASVREATTPFLRTAVNAALAPTIATMATIGIVSLPGMMTGQILGGSFPMVAIKYQIMIMLGIFLSLALALVMNLRLSLPLAFNSYGLLHEDIFTGRR